MLRTVVIHRTLKLKMAVLRRRDAIRVFRMASIPGWWLVVWLFIGLLIASQELVLAEPLSYQGQLSVSQDDESPGESPKAFSISPFWGPDIQDWGHTISALGKLYGFHPDFVAAVIQQEFQSDNRVFNNFGPIGSWEMGLTGTERGDGFVSHDLRTLNPNLHWRMTVLSFVVQQSGGDIHTALAAYYGGWAHLDSQLPREYAAEVIDNFARALVARTGISPELAPSWTVAVEIRTGNVPDEPIITLGRKSLAGVRSNAGHPVYIYADDYGNIFNIRGYAIPLGLSELSDEESLTDSPIQYDPDNLEAPLRARLGDKLARAMPGNPRLMLACLPSLTRLRGSVTTRWYSPSNCPNIGR